MPPTDGTPMLPPIGWYPRSWDRRRRQQCSCSAASRRASSPVRDTALLNDAASGTLSSAQRHWLSAPTSFTQWSSPSAVGSRRASTLATTTRSPT
eukprot:9494729-Pyramimonas_sp.AAC.1